MPAPARAAGAPLCALVVAYGAPASLARCLAALDGAYPVVVVDNASDADTEAVARAAGAAYVDAGANLGFAAAVNRGLERVALPGTDVLLLNPDAAIEPAAVELLRDALAADDSVACAAPAQHRPGSDTPATAVCWPFPTPGRAWAEAAGLGRYAHGWEYVIASVLLVRGAALVDVGGFDEGFFLYAEEADWERRATRRGWSVRYRPDALALHVGAGTDPDPARRHVRFHAGVERYVRKWHGAAGWHSYRAATVLTALRRAAVRRGQARRASLALAALYARGPARVATGSGAVPARRHHVPALGPGPAAT